MLGSAMFATVLSSVEMNSAKQHVNSRMARRRSPAPRPVADPGRASVVVYSTGWPLTVSSTSTLPRMAFE
jgi:hypothetical protein